MERTTTTIHQLHPIEALLLVCLLSIEAIGRLISDPPRPFRRRPPFDELLDQVLEPCLPPYVLPSQSPAAFAAAARATMRLQQRPPARGFALEPEEP